MILHWVVAIHPHPGQALTTAARKRGALGNLTTVVMRFGWSLGEDEDTPREFVLIRFGCVFKPKGVEVSFYTCSVFTQIFHIFSGNCLFSMRFMCIVYFWMVFDSRNVLLSFADLTNSFN